MRRSEGPFTAGKCQVHQEEPGVYDGAAVFDGEGQPFCLIAMDDCVGSDLHAAKARAQRIAESLNRTEGHGDSPALVGQTYSLIDGNGGGGHYPVAPALKEMMDADRERVHIGSFGRRPIAEGLECYGPGSDEFPL